MRFRVAAPFLVRPRFEDRGLLLPRKFIDGQWAPGQRLHFGDGDIGPAISGGLSFFDSSVSNAATIVAPAGIIAGDVILIHDYSARGSGNFPIAVVPTGFTEIINQQAPDTNYTTRTIMSYKIAVGGEAGATITGMAAASWSNKELLVFRPSIPATSVSVSAVNSQATNSAPTAQNVASSGGATPLVVIATWGSEDGTTVTPRDFTPVKDGEISSNTNSWTAYKIMNSSPADVAVSMTDYGRANMLQSFYLGVS